MTGEWGGAFRDPERSLRDGHPAQFVISGDSARQALRDMRPGPVSNRRVQVTLSMAVLVLASSAFAQSKSTAPGQSATTTPAAAEASTQVDRPVAASEPRLELTASG